MSLVPNFLRPKAPVVGPVAAPIIKPVIFPNQTQFLQVVRDHYNLGPEIDVTQLTMLRPPLPWEPKPHDQPLALKFVNLPYTAFRDPAFAKATLKYLQDEYFRFRPDQKTKKVNIDPDAKCFRKWFGKKETVVVESLIDKIEKSLADEDFLTKNSFAEVYKEVLGFDVVDLIKNDQLYRWNNLLKGVFGVAKWAVQNAFPLFAASAIAYTTEQAAAQSGKNITDFISQNYSMGVLAIAALPLIGLRITAMQGVLQALKGGLSAISKVFDKAEKPLGAINAVLKDESPHYLISKYLGFKGSIAKYARVALKQGQAGVELELWKDFEKPYLWYKRQQAKIAFKKDAQKETSALGLSKLFTDLQQTLLEFAPSNQSQTVGRTIETLGTLAWVVSLGIALNQGRMDPAFIGSLAASAGMGALAANIASNHVENTGKFNKALALIYNQAFNFGFALAAILSVQDNNAGLLAYGAKTLLATGAVVGITKFLPTGKKPEETEVSRSAA